MFALDSCELLKMLQRSVDIAVAGTAVPSGELGATLDMNHDVLNVEEVVAARARRV